MLRFRYTMDELQQLVDGLCQRTTAYTDWMNRVERLIDGLETEKAGEKSFLALKVCYGGFLKVLNSLVVYVPVVANTQSVL